MLHLWGEGLAFYGHLPMGLAGMQKLHMCILFITYSLLKFNFKLNSLVIIKLKISEE